MNKMIHLLGGEAKTVIGKLMIDGTIPYGAKLEDWKNEALKAFEPFVNDIKLDENVFTDKDKIATHIEAWNKRINPHSRKKYTAKNTKAIDIYNCLISENKLESLPNLGKHKVISLDHKIDAMTADAVQAIKTMLNVA
jgi:hypothetical protein